MFRHSVFQRCVLSISISSMTLAAWPPITYATPQQVTTERAPAISSREARRLIMHRTRLVIDALRRRDMRGLAAFVHPARGARFSPYIYVDAAADVRFTRAELTGAWREQRRRIWGTQDGTGDDIQMIFRSYFARYVYDRDFARTPQINYNRITRRGNTINNLLEIYPRAILVEYHSPGRDARYGGMDWRSLWLIYEREGREWFLVGIAHDEWTI